MSEDVVEALVKSLADSDPEVRVAAVQSLGRVGSSKAVEALVKALGDSDEKVQIAAVQALTHLLKPITSKSLEGVVDSLVRALKTGSPLARRKAAELLETTGWSPSGEEKPYYLVAKERFGEVVGLGEDAVKPLILTLRDPDSSVRAEAAKALGGIGGDEALMALLGVLGDAESTVRIAVVQALALIRGAGAVKALTKALRDSTLSVRVAAVNALGDAGEAEAVLPLAKALGGSKIPREETVRALTKLVPHSLETLIDALASRNAEVRMLALKSLGEIVKNTDGKLDNIKAYFGLTSESLGGELGTGSEVLDKLESYLRSEEPQIREGVAEILELLNWSPSEVEQEAYYLTAKGSFSKAARLGDVALKPLAQAMKHPNPETRAKVASVLGELENSEAVKLLLNALNDPSEEVRAKAVKALGRAGREEAAKPLVKFIESSSGEIRRAAVKALAEIGGAGIGQLTNLLLHKEKEVSTLALNALTSGTVKKEDVGELSKALKSSDKRVWQEVAKLLEKHGLEPEEEEYKAYYLVALGKVNEAAELGRVALNPLTRVLDSPDTDFRVRVALALGKAGGLEAVPTLKGMLKEEKAEVRVAVAQTLGSIGGTEAVNSLVEVLNDSDPNVREAAASALVSIGKSSAEKLTEALDSPSNEVRRLASLALTQIGLGAIEALIESLKRGDLGAEARSNAAKILEKINRKPKNREEEAYYLVALERLEEAAKLGKEAVNPLILALQSPNAKIRAKAARALGEVRGGIKALAKALKDAVEEVRVAATESLGKIRGGEAIKLLAEALSSYESVEVRIAAIQALRNIGGIGVVDILVGAMKDSVMKIRDDAAEALIAIGPPSVKALTQLLGNPDLGELVARTLDKIGDISLLPQALKSDNPLARLNAASLLEKAGWTPKTSAEQAYYLSARGKFEEAAKLGEVALEPLALALRHPNAEVRVKVAAALKLVGEVALKPLEEALRDEDAETRAAVAQTLGSIGGDEAFQLLTESLEDKSVKVRVATIGSIAKIGGDEAASLLAEFLEDSEVGEEVAKAFPLIGEPALKPLFQFLASPNRKIRVLASQALEKIGSDKILVTLTKALKSRDLNLKIGALEAIPIIVGDKVRSRLKSLGVVDFLTREKVIEFMGPGGKELIKTLTELSDKKNPELSKAAKEALKTVRGETEPTQTEKEEKDVAKKDDQKPDTNTDLEQRGVEETGDIDRELNRLEAEILEGMEEPKVPQGDVIEEKSSLTSELEDLEKELDSSKKSEEKEK